MGANDREKKQRELAIFSRFASMHPAGIKLETFEQPIEPQPDIVCRLNDGERLAFEVVDWQTGRRYEMELMLRREFETQIKRMEAGTEEKFRRDYSNAHVYVEFKYDKSISKIRASVAEIVRWLSCTKHTAGEYRPRVDGIKLVRLSFFDYGPTFGVNTAGMHSEPVVDSVRIKLEKKHYVTTSRLELLCYFDRIAASHARAWEPELVKYLDDNLSSSLFSRVWVCDMNDDGRILFRFPK